MVVCHYISKVSFYVRVQCENKTASSQVPYKEMKNGVL